MTSKIVPWQKAVCIQMIDIGTVRYPATLGKELWVLPPILNPNSDGSGYDPIRNMMVAYDPTLRWFPTNLLDFVGHMVNIQTAMLELKAEFSERVTYVHYADWAGEPEIVI